MGLICCGVFGYILVVGFLALFGEVMALLCFVPPISWGMRRSRVGYWGGRIGLCLIVGLIVVIVFGYAFVEFQWYFGLWYDPVEVMGPPTDLLPDNRDIRLELWLRSAVPDGFDRICLTGDRSICARAELEAEDLREFWGDTWILSYLLRFIVPPMSAVLATWYHTRREAVFGKKKKKRKPRELVYNPLN